MDYQKKACPNEYSVAHLDSDFLKFWVSLLKGLTAMLWQILQLHSFWSYILIIFIGKSQTEFLLVFLDQQHFAIQQPEKKYCFKFEI